MKHKPILQLDFDGVLHSYKSGWKGAHIIPDPPVAGAAKFLIHAQEHFLIAVHSARSHQYGGIPAMRAWCVLHFGEDITERIDFASCKPPASVILDDRAINFDGRWPTVEWLLNFKPWYKRDDTWHHVPYIKQELPQPAINQDLTQCQELPETSEARELLIAAVHKLVQSGKYPHLSKQIKYFLKRTARRED